MTRREIIEAAKQAVLIHGPSSVLEFGPELSFLEDAEVCAEAQKQAERVYNFLGYDSPWKD